MKYRILVALAFSVIFTTVFPVFAGPGAEGVIAVVNMAKVFDADPEAQEADAFLEKKLGEFEAEHKGMLEEREKLKKELDEVILASENKMLSDDARSAKRDLAEARLETLRNLEARIRENMNTRQKELSDQNQRLKRRVVGKLRGIIEEYARKNGYSMVLDSAGLGMSGVPLVLFNGEQADITAEIIRLVGGGVETGGVKGGGTAE